ncbi:MAG: superoxide dismutase [Candidatus Melainabacteria bacterium]
MTTCAPAGLTAQTYDLKGLEGISETTLEQHYKLYGGYVTNTNTVMEKLSAMAKSGGVGTPEYNELKRRFGFEVNGVILHELYFENLKAGGGALDSGSALYKKIVDSYGSYETWEADFKATGMIRGIGWAVMYQCCKTGKLVNCWIGEHEIGHPAGLTPVLIMDVWEHAYANDHMPTGRKAYIDAFFKNINWAAAESRLK